MQRLSKLLLTGAIVAFGFVYATPAGAQYYGSPAAPYGYGYGITGPPYVDYGYYDGGYRFFNDFGYYDGGYFSDYGYYDNWYTDATRFGRGFGPQPFTYNYGFNYGNYYTPNWYDWR